MIPVKQNVLYSPEGLGNGNCMAAAYASVLEIPLWMVPPFEQMFGRGDHDRRCDEWLHRLFGLRRVRCDKHTVLDLPHPPEFYIASGPSPRGVYHAVVYSNGALVHDPHPSDAGIASVEWTYHLVPSTIRRETP